MGIDEKNDGGSTSGQLTRRRFLGTSGKFLVYTSPVLTTLLTSDRALAASVYPYFYVEARGESTGSFTGMPAVGDPAANTPAQWTMQPVVDDFATVTYPQYFVTVLSTNSSVTEATVIRITWTLLSGGGFDRFIWGPGPDAGSNQTVTVPAGGGTLGDGGTIVDSGGAQWPTVVVDNEFSGTVGTVTFERTGGFNTNLKRLTISVVVTAG